MLYTYKYINMFMFICGCVPVGLTYVHMWMCPSRGKLKSFTLTPEERQTLGLGKKGKERKKKKKIKKRADHHVGSSGTNSLRFKEWSQPQKTWVWILYAPLPSRVALGQLVSGCGPPTRSRRKQGEWRSLLGSLQGPSAMLCTTGMASIQNRSANVS